jgi:hypothetical protein
MFIAYSSSEQVMEFDTHGRGVIFPLCLPTTSRLAPALTSSLAVSPNLPVNEQYKIPLDTFDPAWHYSFILFPIESVVLSLYQLTIKIGDPLVVIFHNLFCIAPHFHVFPFLLQLCHHRSCLGRPVQHGHPS